MVVLVILIVLVLAAPYVYQLFHKDSTINFKEFDRVAAQLTKAQKEGKYVMNQADSVKNPHPVLFAFNPNSATATQWQQLGLSGHQADVILHYEAKGGRFYYKRLEPYIDIPDSGSFVRYKKIKPGEVVELNDADSAKLTELPGIGPSIAVRIVRYRGLLGGFLHKEQLKEIYGFDSLKYEGVKNQISVDPAKVKKIRINTISFNQLRLFPYLGYKQVNAIIQYRAQHGNYNSLADLKNIVLLNDTVLTKMEPYLNFK
jgi:competence protein ComEA